MDTPNGIVRHVKDSELLWHVVHMELGELIVAHVAKGMMVTIMANTAKAPMTAEQSVSGFLATVSLTTYSSKAANLMEIFGFSFLVIFGQKLNSQTFLFSIDTIK